LALARTIRRRSRQGRNACRAATTPGGDLQEGELLLWRAVALDPDDPRMRAMLADVLRLSGERDQALAHAVIAMGILERAGSGRELAHARGLVATLR